MKLHAYITDRKIINYVWQFLNRCAEGITLAKKTITNFIPKLSVFMSRSRPTEA